MEELFVSYELALLAKENGFDEECFASIAFDTKYAYIPSKGGKYKNSEFTNDFTVACPMYQQLVDWFRDKHELHISVVSMSFGYVGQHNNSPNPKTWNKDKRYDRKPFKNYYEALSKAIEEAFKLLPKKVVEEIVEKKEVRLHNLTEPTNVLKPFENPKTNFTIITKK